MPYLASHCSSTMAMPGHIRSGFCRAESRDCMALKSYSPDSQRSLRAGPGVTSFLRSGGLRNFNSARVYQIKEGMKQVSTGVSILLGL